jgi:hypothetical protein
MAHLHSDGAGVEVLVVLACDLNVAGGRHLRPEQVFEIVEAAGWDAPD